MAFTQATAAENGTGLSSAARGCSRRRERLALLDALMLEGTDLRVAASFMRADAYFQDSIRAWLSTLAGGQEVVNLESHRGCELDAQPPRIMLFHKAAPPNAPLLPRAQPLLLRSVSTRRGQRRARREVSVTAVPYAVEPAPDRRREEGDEEKLIVPLFLNRRLIQ